MKNKEMIFSIITVIFIIIIICGIYIFYDKYNEQKLNMTSINMENQEIAIYRSLDKVKMYIKEGTLTRTSATIVILDYNEKPYSYDTWFRIDKKSNEEWKELTQIIDDYSWIDIALKTNKDGKLEMKEEWSELYGELENGEYRLVKQQYEDGYKYFWVEFEIK